MDKAVAEGNHREAERISRELYDLQVVHAAKEASTKATYEMKMMVGIGRMECVSRRRVRVRRSQRFTGSRSLVVDLISRFNRKERWERKGNN